MTSPLIISVSGLRGEIGRSLTPEVIMRYALAYSASVSDSRPFVISYDGRPSGAVYAELICSVLNAAGRSTLFAGVAATPTTGILIRQNGAAGGIQISASHNPARFNGLKLFFAQGRVIPRLEGEKILESYKKLEGKDFDQWRDFDQMGKFSILTDTVSEHLKTVLRTVDVELIRSCRFKVLLDSNHGAGSAVGKPFLEALGCEVVFCGGVPDGAFEHEPEPIAENLADIGRKVRESGAQIGFCQDPDADRLAFIDAEGHYPGEEYTIALCVLNKYEKIQTENGTDKNDLTETAENSPSVRSITINGATSQMSIDISQRFGAECWRSAVGEANVVDRMIDKGSFFAGEGNGGPIDPQVGLVRDSFVGMANLLELMARRKKTIAELVAEIPAYSIIKRKISLDPKFLPEIFDRLESKYAQWDQNREDGLRIDRNNSWILVRASNTEPIVRIIAEAESMELASEFCDEAEAVIQEIIANHRSD